MIKNIYVYKGKGHYKDCEHVFECIDDDRKVDINTTGDIVCKVKKWIDFFSKNKGEYFQKWDKIFTFHLIADGINPHIENGQHYIKLNYRLLDKNKLLTHNQALFLLLGLNAYELGKNIKEKDLIPLNCKEDPLAQPIESLLWHTPQNQALLTSSFFEANGKITSEKLEELAEDNNFFTKPDERLKNRNIDESAMRELHKLLIEVGFIDGKFDEIWQWKADRNQLTYLAKKLKQKRIIVKGDCHKELANYIQDPSTAKRQLSVAKDPANTKVIDAIITQLTA